MLEAYTENQKVRIVNNIVRAANGQPFKLSNQAYQYLYLCCGFIAHYNRYGFMTYYGDGSLKSAILRHRNDNQWRNFHPGDKYYEYYKSKADIYNRICDRLG